SFVASSLSFKIDNNIPTATFRQPNDSNKSSYNSNFVSFDVNDTVSGINSISLSGIANSVFSFANHCTKQDKNYHCEYNETAMDISTQNYILNVNATDLAGNSANPAGTITLIYIDNTPPAQITGFSATAGDEKVDLSWTASTTIDFKNYLLYRSTSASFTPESGNLIKTESTKSTTTFSNTGLTNGTTYYFKIIAEDKSGNKSPNSEEKSAAPQVTQTGIPSKPTIRSDTHTEDEWTTNDDPEFRWDSVSDTVDYRYALNDTEDYTVGTENDSTETTREKNYSNREDGIVWFHLAACNSSGCSSTDHYKIKIDKTGPDVATNIFGISQSDGSIFLSWDKSNDRPSGNNSGIAKYIVYRSKDSGFDINEPGVKKFTEITSTNYTDEDTSLVKGIAYYYRVQAIDNVGNEGIRSVEKKVLLSGGSCSLGITIDVPANVKAGELNIGITVSSGDLFDADIKVKMPGKGYETLSTKQEGRSFEEMYLVPEGTTGTGSVLVQGEDTEGNACEKQKEFTVDSVNPTIIIESPAEGEKAVGQILIRVTADDSGSGIEKVEAFVEGIRIGTLEKKGNFYEFSWNSNSKANGTYKLEVSAQDKAGNKAVAEAELEVHNINEEIFIEKQGTFNTANLMDLFKNAGIKEELLSEAQTLFMENSPERNLLITKTDDGLKVTIIITFKNSGNTKGLQLIEVIPKGVTNNANNIVSENPFTVVQQDPIIKFDLGEVANEKAVTVEYIAATGLTEQQANDVAVQFDSYKSPPVLLKQNIQDPVEITPLSDMLWIIFIVAVILVVLIGGIGILGGGAFLFHKMRKNSNSGLKSEGLHTVYKGKSGGFGDLFKKEPEDKKGKFAWNDD
ncbi:MAG: Ig-like domain-containing protein, partial [archaeon]|nr:Ig-like domain-containing protein [archaeon]